MSFLDFIKELLNNNKHNARLIVKDVSKIKGAPDQLMVGLYEDKTPLVGKSVTIRINGVGYSRKTDDDGIAKLNINLPCGEYEPVISFTDSDYNYTSTVCKVRVNPIIESHDLNMREHDGNKFMVKLSDNNSEGIGGCKVLFNINSIDYERTTNENGVASLPINLSHGDYEIMIKSYETIRKNKIHIDEEPPKPTTMDGVNLTKTYGDTTPYQCAVYSDNQRIAGTVDITINGRTYHKTPDKEGLYKLNINLAPGTYLLNAEFQGNYKYASSSIQNTITVEEPPKPQPKSYEQEILEYFESKFGEVNSIDEALSKVEDHGYGYYYDSQYSNKECINRMARWAGINCTDSSQVFYHIGRALGYTVQFIHVECSSGTGHVRLRLKHPVNTGGEWIYRDPAAVLEDNGQGVSYNWCLSGYVLAYDPSWIYEDAWW